MSWTRLDDLWGDKIESTYPEDYALRWHYLKMIQHCSKIQAWDGVLTRTAAERCSDHPSPGEAIRRLVNEQLVQDLGKKVKLTRIDEHIPPPHIRNQQETAAERQRRSRAHRNGDHSLCTPGDSDQPVNCLHATSHRDVTSNVTRDTRTGQDRPGLKDVTEALEDSVDLETGEIDSTPEAPRSGWPWPEPHPWLDAPADEDPEPGPGLPGTGVPVTDPHGDVTPTSDPYTDPGWGTPTVPSFARRAT